MDAEPIAHAKPADQKRLRQRRTPFRGQYLLVDRQFQPQLSQPRAKLRNGA
jgi:hypothetical protein